MFLQPLILFIWKIQDYIQYTFFKMAQKTWTKPKKNSKLPLSEL